MRIVSFLPSATEIVCALGRSESLVGVTHECDFPPEVREKPVVVKGALDLSGLDSEGVDRVVRARSEGGESLYLVDEEALGHLRPDLILTQSLCHVCAPSGNEITRALEALDPKPEILSLAPQGLEDVLGSIVSVGQRVGALEEARGLVRTLKERVERVLTKTRELLQRPRVFFMEWLFPPWCGGHWIPEMIEAAGGHDGLGRPREPSFRISWEEVRAYDPEVWIVGPCGFHLPRVLEESRALKSVQGWRDLACVKEGRVFGVDADSYFARPGPRLVEGLELLAHLFHPGIFPWTGPGSAYRALSRGIL